MALRIGTRVRVIDIWDPETSQAQNGDVGKIIEYDPHWQKGDNRPWDTYLVAFDRGFASYVCRGEIERENNAN